MAQGSNLGEGIQGCSNQGETLSGNQKRKADA